MTQRLSDKCEAIISLLALVFWHLELIPGAMKVQRYGESDGVRDAKPATAYNLECMGRCYTCLAYHKEAQKKPLCPPDETWARVRDGLRRQYRIADVERAVLALNESDPRMAQAVWAVYAEPWPEPRTEPISNEWRERRAQLADEGIVWLAHEIRGPVIAFGLTKREQVEELLRSGVTSTSAIVRAVGCDRRYVKRLKHTQPVRPRQTVDAVS